MGEAKSIDIVQKQSDALIEYTIQTAIEWPILAECLYMIQLKDELSYFNEKFIEKKKNVDFTDLFSVKKA